MSKFELSEEDKALFRTFVADVAPITKQNRTSSFTKNSLKPYFLSDYISENVFTETILSYSHLSFPIKRFNELKKGKIHWEDKLDLHGLSSTSARDALCVFIELQLQKNRRCLLIIHGKGGHQGEPPLIKNLVNRWLPQFKEVLAFHSAQAKDGGAGAVYVLLKKNR